MKADRHDLLQVFGINVLDDDGVTIVHHNIGAKVACVFNEQDAEAAQTENT